MSDFITIVAGILVAQIFGIVLCFGVMLNDWLSSKIAKIVWKITMKNCEELEKFVDEAEKIES